MPGDVLLYIISDFNSKARSPKYWIYFINLFGKLLQSLTYFATQYNFLAID